MNLSVWLSQRLSGNSGPTSRTGSIIAILGVTFAVAVMEITLAISSGFKHEITTKLENFIPPVSITSSGPRVIGDTLLTNMLILDDNLLSPIKNIVPQASLKSNVVVSAVIKTNDDFTAIGLKGYENHDPALFEKDNVIEGKWLSPNESHSIVISQRTANDLDLHIGEKINVCFFLGDRIKARPFNIVGIYKTGFGEFDRLMAYTSSDALRKILNAMDNQATTLELHNISNEDAPYVEEALNQAYFNRSIQLGQSESPYTVRSVAKQGSMYLNWLDLLDTNVIVIFVLMSLVAASTLISSLFIQVLDKINTIGLLRAIGGNNRLIGRIFVYLSLRLVGWGILIGNLIGLGFIFLQNKLHLIPLDSEMYYLDSVPVHTTATTIFLLNIAVIVATWLILILPARLATRRTPASTLRYD